jgi:hypothetical protein
MKVTPTVWLAKYHLWPTIDLALHRANRCSLILPAFSSSKVNVPPSTVRYSRRFL